MALQEHYRKNYGRDYAPVGPVFTQCCERVTVYDNGWPRSHQCKRKNGHGPDGAYCKTHSPETVAEKQKARQEKWDMEMEAFRLRSKLQANASAMLGIIRQIAKGHNDPRQLCADFLREKQFEDE